MLKQTLSADPLSQPVEVVVIDLGRWLTIEIGLLKGGAVVDAPFNWCPEGNRRLGRQRRPGIARCSQRENNKLRLLIQNVVRIVFFVEESAFTLGYEPVGQAGDVDDVALRAEVADQSDIHESDGAGGNVGVLVEPLSQSDVPGLIAG